MPEFKPGEDRIEVPVSRAQVEPVGGARPEPEEMTAKHVMPLESPLAFKGEVNPDGKSIRSSFTYEDNAQTLGRSAQAKCHLCRFWNHEKWAANYQKLDYSPNIEHRKNLQSVRGMFIEGRIQNGDVREMHMTPEDEFSTEDAVRSMGVCEAYTGIFCTTGDLKGKVIISHALASCPRDNPLYGGEAPFLFLPRDEDAKRIGESLHSRVLRLADGRAPKLFFSANGSRESR